MPESQPYTKTRPWRSYEGNTRLALRLCPAGISPVLPTLRRLPENSRWIAVEDERELRYGARKLAQYSPCERSQVEMALTHIGRYPHLRPA